MIQPLKLTFNQWIFKQNTGNHNRFTLERDISCIIFMEKYKGKYRIKSNRADFWNYSAPADYFITVCVADRECILGDVVGSKMVLSEYGEIVKSEIKKICQYHKRVILDAWVVMPNHIHLIISLQDYDFDNGISVISDGANNVVEKIHGNHVEKIHEFSLPQWWHNPDYTPTINEIKEYRKQRRKMLIPKIVGKFKQQTSKHINISRKTEGTKNWQVNYHDHIIRDDKAYHNISNYIINNPQKWEEDKFNPNKPQTDGTT